jgi:ectoine hydroxylase-related dioxygenase (phytanoyl-CoA dioxygenase family)
MRFVEGSHLHGQLKFRSSQEWENNVLTQTVEDVEKYGKIVDVELSAGEISIHSDMLLHSSHYNSSNRRRCGLAIRYCTPDVRCLKDFGWEKDGVLVSGENTGNHWVNNSRPIKEWNGDNLN